jgi:small subunit ribosomal protein S17
MPKNLLKGVVVSDKMDKTVVVRVETVKEHPKYKKKYKSHKRYKAHDENNDCKIGDNVIIQESRPLSKDKRWIVINELQKKVKKKDESEIKNQEIAS